MSDKAICPFCGKEAEAHYNTEDKDYEIWCNRCGAGTHSGKRDLRVIETLDEFDSCEYIEFQDKRYNRSFFDRWSIAKIKEHIAAKDFRFVRSKKTYSTKEYFKRAEKEIITLIAGCIGFAGVLRDKHYRNSALTSWYFERMQWYALKALDTIFRGANQVQTKSALRYADSCELMSIPKTDPRVGKEIYVVPTDAFNRLMDDAVSECAFCDKEGKAINKCQKRRDLLAAGIIPAGESGCPYAGGIE